MAHAIVLVSDPNIIQTDWRPGGRERGRRGPEGWCEKAGLIEGYKWMEGFYEAADDKGALAKEKGRTRGHDISWTDPD